MLAMSSSGNAHSVRQVVAMLAMSSSGNAHSVRPVVAMLAMSSSGNERSVSSTSATLTEPSATKSIRSKVRQIEATVKSSHTKAVI